MNHYELAINDLIEHIKADKGIVQPWRNKAISRMEEATAFIRMGLTTTYREPDGPAPMKFAGPKLECICTELGKRKDCPFHGVSQ